MTLSPVSRDHATVTAPERKKRLAPRPPTVAEPEMVGPLNGTVSNGTSARLLAQPSSGSSAPPTDRRTTHVVPTERPKRPAPTAPATRISTATSPIRPLRSQTDPSDGQIRIPVIGDEIVLNMNSVEFAAPQRPKPAHNEPADYAPVSELTIAVPINSRNAESAGLTAADTEMSTAVECQKTVAKEVGEGDVIHVTSDVVVPPPSEFEDEHVSDASDICGVSSVDEHPVCDASQDRARSADVSAAYSSVPEKETAAQDRVDQDLTCVQKSVEQVADSIGNAAPLAQETAPSATQSKSDNGHQMSPPSLPDHASAENVFESNAVPEGSGESVDRSAVGKEEVSPDGGAEITSRPMTSPVEPAPFRISATDVRQRREELASNDQLDFDTAWQQRCGHGGGGRFRIRSVGKHISYADVFGDDATSVGGSRNDGAGTNRKSSADVVTDAEPVKRQSGIAVVESKKFRKNELQMPLKAADRVTESAVVRRDDDDVTWQCGQIKNESPPKIGDGGTKPRFSVDNDGSDGDAVEKQSGKHSEDVSKLHTAPGKGFVEGAVHVPSGSSQAVDVGLEHKSNDRLAEHHHNIMLDSHPANTDAVSHGEDRKLKSFSTDLETSGGSESVSSRHVEATEQNMSSPLESRWQPTTIVIDMSTLSSVGSLSRRGNQTGSGPTSKSTADSASGAQRVRSGTETSDDDATVKPSSQRNVSEELPPRTTPLPARQSSCDAQTEPVPTYFAAEKRGSSKATVVRVVNGCVVNDPLPPISVAAPTPQPKSRDRSNVTVIHCDTLRSYPGGGGAQNEVATNKLTAKSSDDVEVLPCSNGTALSTAENGGTSLPSAFKPTHQLNSPSTKQAVADKILSPVNTADAGDQTTVAIPEWRRVTTARPRPQVAARSAVRAGWPASKSLTPAANESVSLATTTSIRAEDGSGETATVRSSVESDANVNSSAQDTNSELLQARSMLRPTYRPVTFQVPRPNNQPPANNGETTLSKFFLRSSTLSAKRNFTGADVEDRKVAATSSQVTDSAVNSKSPRSTNSSSSGAISASSPSIATDSAWDGDSGAQSFSLSSPTLGNANAVQTSTFVVKPKPRLKPEMLVGSACSVVEPEKQKTGIRLVRPPPSLAVKSTDDPDVESDVANPAAAALAALQPASRARPVGTRLPPPKLTLHDQLMSAIRDAGGAVPTPRGRSRLVSNTDPRSACTNQSVPSETASAGGPAATESVSGKSTLSVGRNADVEDRKSVEIALPTTNSMANQFRSKNSACSEPTPSDGPTTGLMYEKSSTLPAMKKRPPRVIERPTPTPHEALMAAIRNAGGATPKKGRNHAIATPTYSQPTASEKTNISAASLSSSSEISDAESRLTRESRTAEVTSLVAKSVPAVPERAVSPKAPALVIPEASKASPRRSVAACVARTSLQSEQMDPREALLAAIRGSAGAKGLRKVSSSLSPSSSFIL